MHAGCLGDATLPQSTLALTCAQTFLCSHTYTCSRVCTLGHSQGRAEQTPDLLCFFLEKTVNGDPGARPARPILLSRSHLCPGFCKHRPNSRGLGPKETFPGTLPNETQGWGVPAEGGGEPPSLVSHPAGFPLRPPGPGLCRTRGLVEGSQGEGGSRRPQGAAGAWETGPPQGALRVAPGGVCLSTCLCLGRVL